MEHLDENSLLSSAQHGFRSRLSTQTNLLECLNSWVRAKNSASQTDVLYIDIAKAFDSVDHKKLLHKLKAYGIEGKLLKILESFLRLRKQFVEINGVRSEMVDITSGVPQGSVLGPILFLLYINDMPDCLETSEVSIFADDSKIFLKANDIFDCAKLQIDINKILSWTKTWSLDIAVEKCNILRVGNQFQYEYKMDNQIIPAVCRYVCMYL